MVKRADAPIIVTGVENFIERNYREGGRHQWVRETLVNAIEAKATKVEFGTEWQGVANRRVYRRTIADNGVGMSPEQLITFFRTYGGSGKPIGGIHENFGIGAKCSLFPWNKAGVVIVSWHASVAEPSMIWLRKDPSSGQYGLRTWDTSVGGINVTGAYEDDELGIDWALVKPEWIEDHGTVVVLLGDDLNQDTVLGDPNRDEGGVPGVGIVNYLNRRMWSLEVLEVTVDEYRREVKESWPKNPSITQEGQLQYGRRTVNGAKYYISYPPAEAKREGGIIAQGSVPLSDGTEIDWYLWRGNGRSGIRNAAINGYLCAQYAPDDNRSFPELFDIVDHHSRFRAFGISEGDVRRRLWLVARPPLAGARNYGVYMSSDRSRLLVMGGPKAGDPLPWEDWAIEFADRLPEPIVAAINEARTGAADTSFEDSWRERLAERFGQRWRQLRLALDQKGERRVDADQEGGTPRPKGPHVPRVTESSGTRGGTGGGKAVGNSPGDMPASERRLAVGLPDAEWPSSPEENFERGILAVWNPPSQANPSGLVQLNVSHPVIQEEIRYWVPQYPPHLEDDVVKIIKTVYAQLAVSTVAHSESLRTHLERREELDKLRTPHALTAALLGLVGANAMIGPALGSLGRRRSPVAAGATSS